MWLLAIPLYHIFGAVSIFFLPDISGPLPLSLVPLAFSLLLFCKMGKLK
jgi:hypothetical protein